ncbi:MAG: carboxypeptidase-like regulatory domain-containing protein [Bryobacteraceae bacterium]
MVGSIVDSAGVPQRGASVQLFNKYQQLVAKTASDAEGRFAFISIPADLYSLHATLASFLPAAKDRISVKAGASSVLQVHLATLFSSIELNYVVPTSAMADEWKWVLRSSPATRPISRLLETEDSGPKPRVFTQTHAMLSLSGGDGGTPDAAASLGDWGTGFSVSTTVLGHNELKVSGSYGEVPTVGPPSVTICAIYSPHEEGYFGRPPEVTVMMSQVGVIGAPLAAGQNASSGSALSASSPLRAMSLGMYETADPVDNVHLEYGALAESVDYLQQNSRISPFARLTVDTGRMGQWIASYSDGGQPDALLRHSRNSESDLDGRSSRDFVSAGSLAKLPQLSRQNGRLAMQRTRSIEIGWNKVSGSRVYALSAFSEDVSHGRINMAGDLSAIRSEDLLTDGYATTSSYNIGRYNRKGYLASAVQKAGDHVDLTVAYGRMGGFAANANRFGSLPVGSFVDQRTVNIAAAEVRASIPVIGTQLQGGYAWVDSGTVVPQHLFTTQYNRVSPGFNVYLRQPLPSFPGLPGRIELTADLRNLLAQGYLPIASGAEGQMLVVQAPRSIRGGLNFIF